MEEIVKALLEQNRHLTQQIVDLAKEALNSRVSAPVPDYHGQEAFSPYALTVPESEEDARALHRAGVLDDDELEAALNEIGFYNTEMVVPTAG